MKQLSDNGLSRLIVEIKKLSVEEESSRAEVELLRENLFIQDQTVKLARNDYEKLCLEVSSYEKHIQQSQELLCSSKTMRDWMKDFIRFSNTLRCYIERSEPTNELLSKRLEEYESNVEKMITKYELSPTYLAILEQDRADRELSNLITEKQNELMKLETQREY